jgi:hypothetical protein
VLCVRRLYNEDLFKLKLVTHVEAGSDTSTVTLRVVGGDERGSLKSETVKYGLESRRTRTRERLRWRAPDEARHQDRKTIM